MIDIVFVKK